MNRHHILHQLNAENERPSPGSSVLRCPSLSADEAPAPQLAGCSRWALSISPRSPVHIPQKLTAASPTEGTIGKSRARERPCHPCAAPEPPGHPASCVFRSLVTHARFIQEVLSTQSAGGRTITSLASQPATDSFSTREQPKHPRGTAYLQSELGAAPVSPLGVVPDLRK